MLTVKFDPIFTKVDTELLSLDEILKEDGIYETPGFNDYKFIVSSGVLFSCYGNKIVYIYPDNYCLGWTSEQYIRSSFRIILESN